ncbi:MAG: epoxyqueuosine reductase QueH [Clostridia bacterium]|nr:epoxyqueuosine reductase QueH [Clostridia bacterium]
MKLLLHVCCGPCAVYPVSVLQEDKIDIKGLYFNPNIHPREEFERRRENVKRLAEIKGLDMDYIDDFRQSTWESFEHGQEQRCGMCYGLRLDRAASYAKENGFDAFSTTLLVSPYQNHDLIKELGEKFSQKHGVEFYCRDFRPGFREGQQQAKDLGLYRQKYCGCIVSLEQSEYKEKIIKQLSKLKED